MYDNNNYINIKLYKNINVIILVLVYYYIDIKRYKIAIIIFKLILNRILIL